jgi:hypothetical protein
MPTFIKTDPGNQVLQQKRLKDLVKYLNDRVIRLTSCDGKQYKNPVVDEHPEKLCFVDSSGRVVIDPSATRKTAGVQIDSNEFKVLCMDYDKDPDGAKVQLKNVQ